MIMYSDEIVATNNCQSIAHDIMCSLIEFNDGFTVDDFFKAAREYGMPPDLIEKYSKTYFRSFEAAGYIEQTDRSVVSKRAGVHLTVWIKVKE